MNFKKTWKRANDGFTLVELIVVIAILAILAGVAVPAYSGYIEKANKAGDLQLLSAVNTAFAAAVLESGHDVSDVTAANITRATTSTFARTRTAEAGWRVGGAAVAFSDGKTPDDFSDTFMNYYGNSNGAFKVITSLAWDPATGSFCDISDVSNAGGSVAYVYNGKAITVSAQAVTNLQNSTFGQTIGGEALLNEVAGLTNLVSSGDIDLESMITNEAYMRSIASYIGIKDADSKDYTALVNEMNTKVGSEDASNVMLNGLVYYAAEKTTQMDAADVTTFLTSGNVAANLGSDQATKLANASMAYGMYTAFVNSDQYTGPETSTTSNPMAALQTISGSGEYSEAFTNYVKSTEGQADLTAYMSAMSVINNSTGNDATLDVLANGFDDPELISLLTQAIGK